MTTLSATRERKRMPADAVEATPEQILQAQQCERALGQLYRMYERRISTYVFRRIGHVQEAEDIVANVFLAMVRRLPKYRATGAPMSAWLYRVATNEFNWLLRKRRLRGMWAPLPEIADDGEERSETAEQVSAALLTLPTKQQSVLALHYLQELPVAEVAVVLGIAEGTVKSRLARGRERLKRALSE